MMKFLVKISATTYVIVRLNYLFIKHKGDWNKISAGLKQESLYRRWVQEYAKTYGRYPNRKMRKEMRHSPFLFLAGLSVDVS